LLSPRSASDSTLFQLKNVYHVSGIKKNLLSGSSKGNFVVFRPDDVKVYGEFQFHGTP